MKMSKTPMLLLCSLLCGAGVTFLLSSCASIIHGTRQSVSVNSIPSGAKVIVKGVEMAKTPAVIELKRNKTNIVLCFEKEGCQPVEVALNRKVDGWIVGNIVFGGIIGLAIDFINGAAYHLNPSEVNITLAELRKQGVQIEKLKKGNIVIAVDLRSIQNSKNN